MKVTYAWAMVAMTTFGTPALLAAQAKPSGTAITLVGCIQKESDYRKATGSGTGGGAGFGIGLGDEYVLIGATRAGSAAAPVNDSTVNGIAVAASDCANVKGGEAFELTGPHERELARFSGQRVEITGTLKPGTDAPTGTSGTEVRTDTTGLDKLNPWAQDLNLQEVEVGTFRAVK